MFVYDFDREQGRPVKEKHFCEFRVTRERVVIDMFREIPD
jgi:hypothetical protein